MTDFPSLEAVRANAERLAPYIVKTPVHVWRGRELERRLGAGTQIVLKLELFQRSGTFKARGALTNMLRMSDAQQARGVTTVSAGNHAIAVAFGAAALGLDAKVVMLESANPARVAAAKAYGAEVVIGGGGPECFALMETIARDEGRVIIHPFEGEGVTLGTASCGLELAEQAGALEAVIVPIGGGGLASGLGLAVKALWPACKVYGVEPEGADSMHRSFAAGAPQTLEKIDTIADSLAPPMALPYSFAVCRKFIDDLVKISDDEMRRAMALLFHDMKLAVEPAGAAATAALIGPLREKLAGKRVGVIVCGANIDADSFADHLRRGDALLRET